MAAEKFEISPETYLAMERKAETKSEYFNGKVFAMSGASRRHNIICGNMFAVVHRQFRNQNCEAYTGNMRVKVSPTGLYAYPDVVLVCGEPLFEDDQRDTLLNPTVIIEVLSESTEPYDRGQKFSSYRALESLTDYLLIAQDAICVEHYRRQADHQWLFSEYKDSGDRIQLDAVSCELKLAELYEKIDFS